MDYKVYIKPSASKDLEALPDKAVKTILHHIKQLEINPGPIGIQKLTNEEGYRIRSGNYRILFEINDKLHSVTFIELNTGKMFIENSVWLFEKEKELYPQN